MTLSEEFKILTGMSCVEFDRKHSLCRDHTLRALQRGHSSLQERSKEGWSKHPLYPTWEGVIMRCYNRNFKAYHNYGGRGIRVCWEWLNSPSKFFSDMGDRPSPKHQLDRIDTNGGYSKGNCRWALPIVNAFNKRDAVNMNGFRGVTAFRNKFQANLHIQRKQIYIGTFRTAEEAYKAYRAACLEWYGVIPLEKGVSI